MWKKSLQEPANDEQLAISVVHHPPATSKLNKIERRLFSFISINWRAKLLTCLQVVLELISHTTTEEGLRVVKRIDYAKAHIPEYWIVNPLDETVTVLRLEGEEYAEHGVFQRGEAATSALLQGFTPSVSDVFDAQ